MQQQQTIALWNPTVYAVLSAALFCLVLTKPSTAQGNSVDKTCMLEGHNILRADVGVQELHWSDALARQAATWAEELKKSGCGMKHSHAARVGENLYWASPLKTGNRSKGKSTWRWSLTQQPIKEETVITAWATEQPWYSAATNTCDAPPGKTCGHYTQMIWTDTREIGCAKAVCNDNSQVWVCNYAPAGNVIGQRPY